MELFFCHKFFKKLSFIVKQQNLSYTCKSKNKKPKQNLRMEKLNCKVCKEIFKKRKEIDFWV